jgi:hypothetical protein
MSPGTYAFAGTARGSRDKNTIEIQSIGRTGLAFSLVVDNNSAIRFGAYCRKMLDFERARDLFGDARIPTYLDKSQGSQSLALELYKWNSSLAAAYWRDIEAVEIMVRNRIARVLFPDGFISKNFLAQNTTGKYSLEVGKENIASQTFGFWTYLLSNENNNKLWSKSLHKAFIPKTNRAQLHSDLKAIQVLRNRIGHHEPIWEMANQDMEKRFERVFGAISKDAIIWQIEERKVRQAVIRQFPVRT